MTDHGQSRKVAFASLLGTTTEYYDFFIYGTAAALVFNQLFFPSYDTFVGTLLSFATFAVAFIARPIGGVVFGHYGDRIGRKAMLVITLLGMGGTTFVIGLIPSYDAIGIAAPILLVVLRTLQGFCLGGEYGGAVLMTVEHAAADRRGFLASWVQLGAPFGLIAANVVFLLVADLSPEAMLSWGWRVPFLASALLVILGVAIRLTIGESPSFEQVKQAGAVSRAPLLVVVRDSLPVVLLTAGATISVGVTFYGTTVFGLSYGVSELGKSKSEMLLVVVIGMAFTAALVLLFGRLSDRVGRKPIFVAGQIGLILLAFPWILLSDSPSFAMTLAGYLLIFIPYSATWATMGALLAEVFDTRVRYSGLSLGYTLGNIVGAAFAPIIAANLLEFTGDITAVGWYMVAAAAISTLAALRLRPDLHATQEASRPAVLE